MKKPSIFSKDYEKIMRKRTTGEICRYFLR